MLRDKVIWFLLGSILGIFLTLAFLGLGYLGYKVGGKLLHSMNPEQAKLVPKIIQRQGKVSNFKLGFESKKDLEFFELKDGLYVEQSEYFVTEGKHSLLAEYPKGATYPGLSWEVYKKDKCLDFSERDRFSFNVHNNSEIDVVLNVKLKSGANYPKKVYETHINLPAQQSKKVKISIEDLWNELNPKEISYIKLFIVKPKENIVLYFDNIQVL